MLDDILAKTVITRTFAEVTGKELRRIHQMPIPFAPDEREAYQLVLQKFYEVQRRYFLSTGNSRKDAMMRLIQQITLLLRVSAAPDTLEEYIGDTPLKEVAIVELIHKWPNEVVAVGFGTQQSWTATQRHFGGICQIVRSSVSQAPLCPSPSGGPCAGN